MNSMIGAQSDSIGRGADGSESGKEFGTLDSWAAQRIMLVFGSITAETAAPEAVSSHPSSIGAVGSELRVGADAGAASGVLVGDSTTGGKPALGSRVDSLKIRSP